MDLQATQLANEPPQKIIDSMFLVVIVIVLIGFNIYITLKKCFMYGNKFHRSANEGFKQYLYYLI